MAYLLRSNTSVNDPNGRFPFYTPYGFTNNKETSQYLTDMEQQGYVVDESEYNALDSFVTGLKNDLIWDKVFEVYPIMGNSYLSAAVKLKEHMGGRIMTPVGGLNDSLFEFSGGKILGKTQTPFTAAGGAPRFETGVTVASLIDTSAGFHFYCGNMRGLDSGAQQAVIGTLQETNISSGVLTQMAWSGASGETRFAVSHVNRMSTSDFTNDLVLQGFLTVPNLYADPNQLLVRSYREGELITQGGGIRNLSVVGTDATLALFGRNSYDGSTATATSSGYSGVARFGCITSGEITTDEVALLHTRIDTLLTALGKKAS